MASDKITINSKLDNITFSPHSSAWSSQLWDRRFKFVCENLENLYMIYLVVLDKKLLTFNKL